ncbi:MAG: DUF5606 domain-containing protein [Sphingobacteriaceae bacterium]|nr:DUF5606 domain-containing protein [Sphingobacteriaceae bacterium]
MDLKGIVNITGKPGLFKVLSTTKGGFIVEALDGTAKRSVIPGTSKVAALEDISVYTSEEQEALKDIFKRMKAEKVDLSGMDLTKADNADIIKTFETLVPNYDREQVYVSDMRKLMKWYVILAPMLDFSAAEAEAAAEAAPAAKVAAPEAEAKPAKAAAAKKPKAPKKD